MKVVIHAGIHRTGTTSLQRCLATNRAALAAQGVGYPGEDVHHQKLAWALKRGNAGVQDVEALLVAVQQLKTVVLSGEDFCIHTDLGWLAELARRWRTSAVFYLRRQDHWVMSWYNQHVKWPFDRRKSQMGPQAFLSTIDDFHWLDYATLLDRWRSILGHDQVKVGIVEGGQVEDVTIDFLDRLNIDRNCLNLATSRSNDSLPVHVLEVARHLGLADLAPKQRTRLLAALKNGLADKAQPARTVFSPAERLGILDRFAASNRQVARQFFERDQLFFEPPPGPDDPYFRFRDMPRKKLMREWVAPVVSRLLRTGKP